MLLSRLRRVTQFLQAEGMDLQFGAFAQVLAEVIEGTSVHLVNRKGKVLGHSDPAGWPLVALSSNWAEDGRVSDEVNVALLKVGSLLTDPEARSVLGEEGAMIVPVVGNGQRVATLLFLSPGRLYDEEDQAIGEFAATVLGMVIAQAMDEEAEGEAEEKRRARAAIRSLSYSEVVAMQRIFEELEGNEGLLVASRIADQAGITRSVIVNALRKLASANVIESRSLGMKGTYLRVLNPEIRNELAKERFPFARRVLYRKHA